MSKVTKCNCLPLNVALRADRDKLKTEGEGVHSIQDPIASSVSRFT
jgi:hypothetical protein